MPSLQRYFAALTFAASSASLLIFARIWDTRFRWNYHEQRNKVVHYHTTLGDHTRDSTLEETLASGGRMSRILGYCLKMKHRMGLAVEERDANDTKTILLIGKFYLNTRSTFASCPVTSCRLVQESEGFDPKVADVIMFASNIDKKKLAKKFLPKPLKQIWIASHMESSARNWLKTSELGPYINWSATYRPDSHIMTPYGRFYRKKPQKTVAPSPPTFTNWAANRTKQVAWFVSNCWDKNGRRNFAQELAKHIKVDIYGRCGTLTCPRNKSSNCFERLKKDYKFYLAFENSNCRYYMTEKLFLNAYSNNVIPIVMGALPADYALALPPHSYIHVDDFESPRDLANYLRRLDADDRLYNEYFRWKTEWSISYVRYDMCVICGLLHAADFQNYVHWYPEYTQYWDANACSLKWKNINGVRWQHW